MSDHTVTYKACKGHRRSPLDGATLERLCEDCRRLTFRATMAAWGMPVKVPTYNGRWPLADAYEGFPYAHRTTDDDHRKLELWIRNATATVEA